jgi:hypothetical protein
MRILQIGLAAASLLASAGPAAANLLTNGSFESSTGTNGNSSGYGQVGYNVNLTGWGINTAQDANGYTFLFNASNAVGGVTGQYGSLALWGTGNGGINTITASPDGDSFVAIDSAFQDAALQQTVTGLTVGTTYELSFFWGAAQQYTFNGATTDKFQVSFGSQTQTTSIISLPSHGFSGWVPQSFTFTADSTSDVLSFFAIGTPSGVPPFAVLDGVDLETVPEPASLGVLAAGLLGLLVLRRKEGLLF